jgi:hypothetical protein
LNKALTNPPGKEDSVIRSKTDGDRMEI